MWRPLRPRFLLGGSWWMCSPVLNDFASRTNEINRTNFESLRCRQYWQHGPKAGPISEQLIGATHLDDPIAKICWATDQAVSDHRPCVFDIHMHLSIYLGHIFKIIKVNQLRQHFRARDTNSISTFCNWCSDCCFLFEKWAREGGLGKWRYITIFSRTDTFL